MDYREHREVVRVPKGTGIPGFLRAIEAILKLDRVQRVNIDARGEVSYTRFVVAGEEAQDLGPRLDFEELMPYAVVRNGKIDEVTITPNTSAVLAVSLLFGAVGREKLYPVAFVTGANTTLFSWLEASSGQVLAPRDDFFGLPLLRDRLVDDAVLILAAAYGRGANFSDVQHSFKIAMPQGTSHALARDGRAQGGNPVRGDTQRIPTVGDVPRDTNGHLVPKPGGGSTGH